MSLLEVVELAPIWDPSGLGARMACYVMFTLLGANAQNVLAARQTRVADVEQSGCVAARAGAPRRSATD